MSETNQNDRKHETIDILVDPKRSEPTLPLSEKKTQPPVPEPVPNNGAARPAAPARTPQSAAPNSRASAQATRKITPAPAPVRPASSAPSAPKAAPESRAASKPTSSASGNNKAAPEKGSGKSGVRSTVVRTLIYIAFVAVISTILSVIAITCVNDIFALVKDEVTATVEIPEDATISEVAGILKDEGIIKYPLVFRMYVGYRHRKDDPPLSFKAGSYELKSTLNYDQITSMIRQKSSRDIVKITIPEGLTVKETIQLFLGHGIGTREGFIKAINEYPYEYTFMEKLNAIQLPEGRSYRLEGYLFPDTYEFYTDSTEVDVIDKLLATFEAHFEKAYYDRLDELGMNLDQVVTLASMVQMEGRTQNDFYSIAGVFNNRLHSNNFVYLQSDATVQFVLQAHKKDLTADDLAVSSPYNTYTVKGLPAGPISNPGWAAIQAALYPESNDYYFFIANTDGTTLFAKDITEHQKNAALVRANREKAASN